MPRLVVIPAAAGGGLSVPIAMYHRRKNSQMSQILKQSTAVDVLIGPFVDDTDGNTEETALTLANTDVLLSKNGQTMAAKSDVTSCAHDANGMYNCELDGTDTNTIGQLTLFVHKTGALAVRHDYQVVEEAIYDAMFATSAAAFDANQRVDVGSWLGTAVTTSATSAKPEVDVNSISDDATAANNCELMFDGTGYAGGTTNLQVDAVAISGDTAAADNVEADYDGTGYAKTNSTIGTTTAVTNQVTADSTAINGDATAAANLANLFANIDTQINVGSATASTIVFDDAAMIGTDDYYNGMVVFVYGGTGSGQARIITDYAGASKTATISPNWGTNPDATSDVMVVPFGANDDLTTTQKASVNAECDTALTDYDALVPADLPSNFADLSITASTGRIDVGSWLGTAVTTSTTTSKPEVDVNSISDDATAANNCELMFDGTGYAGGTTKLDVNVASSDDIDLTATQKVSVNTEVLDVLNTDTLSELGVAAPSATPTHRQAIMAVYMALRNKVTVTSTQKKFHNDAGTNVFTKALSDDGTTYTEDEAA